MTFKNRTEVGKLLAKKIKEMNVGNAVVYGIPRGGLVCAKEIAQELNLPFSAIITRKIGHPNNPEYAIGAVAEDGDTELSPEASGIDQGWLKKKIDEKKLEAKNRREYILMGDNPLPAQGQTAIIVDDGLATGYTMAVAIKEIKHLNPKRIIVATGVAPDETVKQLQKNSCEVVVLEIPTVFLDAIGNYYESFEQVDDEQARAIFLSAKNKKL